MLFRNVGLVTSLPGLALSCGFKCSAGADIVPVGVLPMCPPRSCGVFPKMSGASRSAQEMPHTHATEDTSSVNPSLELTCDSETKPYARLRMKLWSHNAGRPWAGVPKNRRQWKRACRALVFRMISRRQRQAVR